MKCLKKQTDEQKKTSKQPYYDQSRHRYSFDSLDTIVCAVSVLDMKTCGPEALVL